MRRHPESPHVAPFPEGYRASGLLLHVTSLPSPYGIGDVEPGAVKWIDKLSEAGRSWWQALQGRGDRAVELWNLINPVYHATTVEEVQHYKAERMWLVPACMEPRRTRAAAAGRGILARRVGSTA